MSVRNKPLEGKIALVTGATRGIGRGIAIQLGEAGATVYFTGRTVRSTNGLGSLEDTAAEIRARAGKCIPIQVDHEDDKQIEELFEQIKREQDGRLDILVNNAYKGVTPIFENSSLKFWEMKPEIWDDINNVGLRNHYICTVYAARLMVPRKQGLIINISSVGGLRYLFNVPYGIGKAAVDRMAVDCGIELKKFNVAMLSLYVGAVKTELIKSHIDQSPEKTLTTTDTDDFAGNIADRFKEVFNEAESTEFSGKVVAALAQDPHIMRYTSRILIAEEYAQQHSIKDIDGRVIHSFRQIKNLAKILLPEKIKFISDYIPGFIKIPTFVIDLFTSKF